MTWTDLHCLVVANGVLQNSSDVFYLLDPDVGGANTFTVPLSADGSAPATHWAAYTPLQIATRDALLNMTVQEFMDYVNLKAAEFGRDPIGSVTAFKNNVQISAENENPWNYIASLGLQRVVTEEI